MIPDLQPVPTSQNADWLDDLLLNSAPPLADDGFSTRVVQRIGELAKPGATSPPAACISPAAALAALSMVRGRRSDWWRAGATACVGMVASAVFTLGGPSATGDLVGLWQQVALLASVPLLTGWLLAQSSRNSGYL